MRKKIIIITGLILFGCIILFHVQINMTNNEIKDVAIENAKVLADFDPAPCVASSSDCAVDEGSICVYDGGSNCACAEDEKPTTNPSGTCLPPC